MNKHLSKIVIDYIEQKLPFTIELKNKTRDLYYDISGWRYYTNYTVKYSNGDFVFDIGHVINNKYKIKTYSIDIGYYVDNV